MMDDKINIDKKVKILALALGVFLFLIFGFFYVVLSSTSDFPENKVITIKKNSSLSEIAGQLEKENVIRRNSFFKFWAVLIGKSRKIRAGNYIFEKPLSLFALTKRLTKDFSGSDIIRITIPEGYNLRDIGFLFENLGMFQAEEIWETAGFPWADYRKNKDLPPPRNFSEFSELVSLKPQSVGLEGYLFPDTYFLSPNNSVEEIILIILQNLEKRITPQMRFEAQRQRKSFHEILTMASLLEEEARDTNDKKIIAGILWKRLKAGVPLQVDATLTYITGRTSHELTDENLKIDSAFNTYLYQGLPLGPIANPGLGSIEASLYPQESPYWYYLSDSQGKIHYSSTFEEHKGKKFQYLR